MMGAHDRRVDHLHGSRRAAFLVERIEHQFEQAGFRPAPELPVDRVPLAEMLVQIAPGRPGPRDPEDAVEYLPMILRRPTALAAPCDHQGFEKRPFLVAHQAANQDRLPKSSLESPFAIHVNLLCQRGLNKFDVRRDWRLFNRWHPPQGVANGLPPKWLRLINFPHGF